MAWPLSILQPKRRLYRNVPFFHLHYILPISGSRISPAGRHTHSRTHEQVTPKIRWQTAHRHGEAQQLKLPASVARSEIYMVLSFLASRPGSVHLRSLETFNSCHVKTTTFIASLSPFCQNVPSLSIPRGPRNRPSTATGWPGCAIQAAGSSLHATNLSCLWDDDPEMQA